MAPETLLRLQVAGLVASVICVATCSVFMWVWWGSKRRLDKARERYEIAQTRYEDALFELDPSAGGYRGADGSNDPGDRRPH